MVLPLAENYNDLSNAWNNGAFCYNSWQERQADLLTICVDADYYFENGFMGCCVGDQILTNFQGITFGGLPFTASTAKSLIERSTTVRYFQWSAQRGKTRLNLATTAIPK